MPADSIYRATVLASILVATLAAGRGSAREAAPAEPPTRAEIVSAVEDGLSPSRLRAHLVALQRIADANGGTRVAASAGYEASVRYVHDALVLAGYRPAVLSFPFVEFAEHTERARQLAPVRRVLRIEAIDYSPSTPPGGVRARVEPARGRGCAPGDFAGVRGRIAIVARGVCFMAIKAQNAQAAGAVALLVFPAEPGPIDGTLGDPNASRIPVAGVEEPVARSLARTRALVRLELETSKHPSASENVVADNVPGARRVLVVGAHLDSVLAGPGINDNGTGVAALLEIARVLKREAPELAVRFAFWGAEEFGLFGSEAYAAGAVEAGVAAYLNFDMLGSRGGPPYFVYQGPFARRLLAYFGRRGLQAEPIDLTGRSDHFAFEQIGVPTGGIFAGDDPCYHRACDRLKAVDFGQFRRLAAAAAFAVATLAPPRATP